MSDDPKTYRGPGGQQLPCRGGHGPICTCPLRDDISDGAEEAYARDHGGRTWPNATAAERRRYLGAVVAATMAPGRPAGTPRHGRAAARLTAWITRWGNR